VEAALPDNETDRLAALYALDILDSAPEQDFDDIVSLASNVCGTPMSLVTLVDTDRQWSKARVGQDLTETSRELSFCAHAILGQDLLVVPDATKDARFSDNPQVDAKDGIRFLRGRAAGHHRRVRARDALRDGQKATQARPRAASRVAGTVPAGHGPDGVAPACDRAGQHRGFLDLMHHLTSMAEAGFGTESLHMRQIDLTKITQRAVETTRIRTPSMTRGRGGGGGGPCRVGVRVGAGVSPGDRGWWSPRGLGCGAAAALWAVDRAAAGALPGVPTAGRVSAGGTGGSASAARCVPVAASASGARASSS
jgi:hypothetical protein